MPEEQVKTCSDCNGALRPITIMDRGDLNRFAGELTYRMVDDKLSFWTGRYPTAGPVQAFLCQDCGRIALFGKPTASAD